MNHKDGEFPLQDKAGQIAKTPPVGDTKTTLEVEEEGSIDHVNEGFAYCYVGDYKDFARYDAVGDTQGITLGFEIECEYRHDMHDDEDRDYDDDDEGSYAEEIQESNMAASESDAISAISRSMNKGYILAERDGSLEASGVEFVTGYCTWESHKPRLQRFFAEYKNDFTAATSAGIHIHIGRNEFTAALDWEHLYWFICCAQNKPLIEHVAGRYNCRASRANKEYSCGGRVDNESRYDAVNRRDETWELRMFTSTTDWTVMQEYAEFSLACVGFLIQNKAGMSTWMLENNTDFSTSPLSYPHFIEWVSTQAVSFPNLNKHLERM